MRVMNFSMSTGKFFFRRDAIPDPTFSSYHVGSVGETSAQDGWRQKKRRMPSHECSRNVKPRT